MRRQSPRRATWPPQNHETTIKMLLNSASIDKLLPAKDESSAVIAIFINKKKVTFLQVCFAPIRIAMPSFYGARYQKLATAYITLNEAPR